MPLSPAAIAGLNEVLLQAALRAERRRAREATDQEAREIAKRWDQRAKEQAEQSE